MIDIKDIYKIPRVKTISDAHISINWLYTSCRIPNFTLISDNPGIYFLFNQNKLMYIGASSINILKRITAHCREKIFDECSFLTEEELKQLGFNSIFVLEDRLIKEYLPQWNKQHNRKHTEERWVNIFSINNNPSLDAIIYSTKKEAKEQDQKIENYIDTALLRWKEWNKPHKGLEI